MKQNLKPLVYVMDVNGSFPFPRPFTTYSSLLCRGGLPDLISRPRKASNSPGTGLSEAPESSSETVDVTTVEGVPGAEEHVDEPDNAGGHVVPHYGVPSRVATAGVARVCVALPPSLCAHRWICVSIAGAAAVQLSRGK